MKNLKCKLFGHLKGDRCMFAFKTSMFTGQIYALYHCKNCSKVLSFPISNEEVGLLIKELNLK
jgi:hypothetical protein